MNKKNYKHSFLKIITTVVVSLLFSTHLLALDPSKSISQYIQKNWQNKDGALSNMKCTFMLISYWTRLVGYFKQYNDSLGHLEGDASIKAVAKC